MKPLKIEFDDSSAYCHRCDTMLRALSERCKCEPSPPARGRLTPAEMADIITKIEERNKCRE